MKAEPYLSINPMGKVPAIRHNGRVVTEVAAICCYLADAFPEANLAPPPADRADYYRWIFFTSGPIEAAFSNKAAGWEPAPERQAMFGYGTYDKAIATLEIALSGPISSPATASPPPTCSSARWSISCSQFNLLDPRPVFTDYAARMTDRDAFRRAREIDGKLIAEMQAQHRNQLSSGVVQQRRRD